MTKTLIGIRHGEALHNVVAKIYGSKVYKEFVDNKEKEA